ncbi:hypothetical protein JG687_00015031 [Phytophthora cactorum]|uniref:Uncharacterized protein n=1 Tax=Phytophthora cactorum TaxID=29920 RepID=A0A329SJI8_9STRA|nr:hypothetical protein Pcac1_g11642 [Phytophthora cactorum]KAG2800050.1 hypothetical protein PC112_g20649 [Phytophthora cactorum]KAG2800203.1 hypothetical protein PC111_g20074 [Phytophthora cactorum]KAG2849682.1 hypothetical protein PC113_g17339 [Phytophthora cactorum]KAG2879331.1 hypothetical protein PC114_g22622 [Phytophthora cactorum]
MTDLAKEIPTLVDRYVTSAGDQALTEYWQHDGRRSTGIAPGSQEPASSVPSTSGKRRGDGGGAPARPSRQKKRRRRPARREVSGTSQESVNRAGESRVLPGGSQSQQVRLEEARGREDQDSRALLGRQTRSMTTNCSYLGTTGLGFGTSDGASTGT